jgi:organic radical activating enzyme
MKWKQRLLMPIRYLAWRTGMTVPPVPPDRIYLETTNRCNLKCPQCPTGLNITGRAKGDMDEGLFRTIVDEMGPLAETAVLHVWGEPLLNPHLESMISYAARKDLKTEISTNATLLDETRARSLLATGLSRIYLCIDGLDEATYNKVRVGGDFTTVRNNIQGFVHRNREAGGAVDVQVQLIDIDMTRDQVQAFRQEWSRPGVNAVHIKTFDSWGGQVEDINALNEGAKRPEPDLQRYPCPNLWYHAHIFYDGTLVCCDRDFEIAHPLGNVAEGVMRTWRGDEMKSLRRAHIKGEIDVDPCKACKEWKWWKPRFLSSWGNAPQEGAA